MIQSAPVVVPPLLKTELRFAGFWRRLLAYLIDGLVILAVQLVLTILVVMIAPDDLRAAANIAPVSAAVAWAYFALLESSPARATLGKMALNLFVSDVHGDPISFWRASVRFWLKILSSLVVGLGWLMAAFTPRKQALHDLLAGTLVLRKVNYLVMGPEAPTEPGDYWDGSRWAASVPPPMETS
jgi:uncharacterized RDD family membrane protein YckC